MRQDHLLSFVYLIDQFEAYLEAVAYLILTRQNSRMSGPNLGVLSAVFQPYEQVRGQIRVKRCNSDIFSFKIHSIKRPIPSNI